RGSSRVRCPGSSRWPAGAVSVASPRSTDAHDGHAHDAAGRPEPNSLADVASEKGTADRAVGGHAARVRIRLVLGDQRELILPVAIPNPDARADPDHALVCRSHAHLTRSLLTPAQRSAGP